MRRIADAAMVIAGLKCPPLTCPKAMIRRKSANACTRPTTAKSDPVCDASLVATKRVTTTPMTKTRNIVPISSAM